MTELLILALLLGVTAVTGIAAVRRKIAIVDVTGPSMEPTLTAGDRVVVRRTGLQAVRTGQIVVVEAPSTWTRMPSGRDLHCEWMIKRAAAVPGDPLPAGLPATLAGDARVPAGKLVVLGDNSKASVDSRSLGYVSGDRLLGVVTRQLQRRGLRSAAAGDADVARGLVDDEERPVGPHGQALGGVDAGDQGADRP